MIKNFIATALLFLVLPICQCMLPILKRTSTGRLGLEGGAVLSNCVKVTFFDTTIYSALFILLRP